MTFVTVVVKMLFRAGWKMVNRCESDDLFHNFNIYKTAYLNAYFLVDFVATLVTWRHQMNSHMSLLRVHHSGREQSRESFATSSNNSEPNSHDVWHAKRKKKWLDWTLENSLGDDFFFYPLDLAKDSIMSDLGNHRLLKQWRQIW